MKPSAQKPLWERLHEGNREAKRDFKREAINFALVIFFALLLMAILYPLLSWGLHHMIKQF